MANPAFNLPSLVSAVPLPAHTSLEVQEKPSVAEVEMGVITILVHQLKELRVQNLPRKAKGNPSVHTRDTSDALPAPIALLPYLCFTPSPSFAALTQVIPRLSSQHPLLLSCSPQQPLLSPHPQNRKGCRTQARTTLPGSEISCWQSECPWLRRGGNSDSSFS